ncbi:hypothetical protein AKJ16_DCAP27501 [Drosera capensis]
MFWGKKIRAWNLEHGAWSLKQSSSEGIKRCNSQKDYAGRELKQDELMVSEVLCSVLQYPSRGGVFMSTLYTKISCRVCSECLSGEFVGFVIVFFIFCSVDMIRYLQYGR